MLGGLAIYQIPGFSYPPLSLYLLSLIFFPLSLVLDPSSYAVGTPELTPARWAVAYDSRYVTTFAFNVAVKAPLILADVLIGLVLYEALRQWTDRPRARLGAALWLLNPLVILVSAVQGQIDTLATLCALLALVAVSAGWHLTTGAALLLGAGFKVYPVALFPLYAMLILGRTFWAHRSLSFATAAKRSLLEIGKFSAPVLLLLLLVGIFALREPVVAAVVRTRLQGLSYGVPTTYYLGGGLNFWSLKVQPPFAEIFLRHGPLITQASSLLVLGGSLVVAALAGWTSRRSLIGAAVLGHTAVIALVLLGAKVVTQQYLTWLLPPLILAAILSERPLLIAAMSIITTAGFAYLFFFMNGVDGLFLPLMMQLSAGDLDRIRDAFIAAPQIRDAAVVPLGVLVALMLLLILIRLPGAFPPLVRRFPTTPLTNHRAAAWTPLPLTRTVLPCLVALTVGGFVAARVGPSLIERPRGLIGDMVPAGDGRVAVPYRVESGTFRGEYRVVAFPLRADTPDGARSVYLFFDPRYPSRVPQEPALHLFAHLRAQLALRGYRGPVQAVNADELAAVLRSEVPSVVIIASGAVPDTVLDEAGEFSRLRKWLEKGGTLIWIGEDFGHYLARPDALYIRPDASRIQEAVFGAPVFRGPDRSTDRESYAFEPSPVSAALDLQYDVAWYPLDPLWLQRQGGQAIGRVRRDTLGAVVSSINYLPVGRGQLIAFAFPVEQDAAIIGRDIAQILFTRFLDAVPASGWAEKATLASVEVDLGRLATAEGVLEVAVPPESRAVAITIYAKFDQTPLFVSKVLPVPGQVPAHSP